MKRALLLAAAALGMSCGLLQQVVRDVYVPPALAFRGESITGASLDRATVTLSWVLTNPNPFPVEVTGAQATLSVEGQAVPVGAPAAPLTRVPAEGQVAFAFPAELRFQKLGVLGQEKARYRAQGAVSVISPLTGAPVQLPLDRDGELALPRAPTVAVSMPRLTGLSLAGASLEVPVQVTNANAFALGFSLEGSLTVGSVQPVTFSMPAEQQVGARETKVLALPGEISFLGVTVAASALSAGLAPIAFEGALRSGEVSIPVRFSDALKLPRLRLKDLALTEMSLEGATAVVTVATENPLPIPIDLGQSRLALFIEANKVAEFLPPPGTSLVPASAGDIALPVRFSFGSLITAAVAGVTRPRTVKVRVEGTLALPTPVGVFQVPMEETRPFELPRLPELAFGPPRLSGLSLTSATVEVPVTLTNRNGFAIPSVGMSGSLAIGGARVGEISSGDLGTLEAGGARTFSVPIVIDFLRSAAAAQAVRSGTASLAFDGAVASGGLSLPMRWTQTVSFAR